MARKIAEDKQKRKATDVPAVKENSAAYKADTDPVETLLPYRSFEIENFRCIKKLAIAPLEQVNLIAGMNNVGKTTLLEAIFLHIGETNPELALRVDGWRGLGPEISSTWRQLFWQFKDDVPIRLTAAGRKDKKRTLTVSTLPADATIIEDVVSKERGAASRSSGIDIRFEYEDEQKKLKEVIGTLSMGMQ
jgi:ABC-type cobalamin/Fe3+-siderophores transport system ATPase subunit